MVETRSTGSPRTARLALYDANQPRLARAI